MLLLAKVIALVTAIAVMVGKIAEAVSSIKKARTAKRKAKADATSSDTAQIRFTFSEIMEMVSQLVSVAAFFTLIWWMFAPPSDSDLFATVCGVAVLVIVSIGPRRLRL